MAVSALAFAPEGGRIATGSWDDTVRLWETATGAEVAAYADHPAAVHAVAFAPDGRTLAVLSGSGELRFWHLAIGREAGVRSFPAVDGTGWLRFSPAGNWLAVVSPGGALTLLPAPRDRADPAIRR
jgi:WD40 repeat protein